MPAGVDRRPRRRNVGAAADPLNVMPAGMPADVEKTIRRAVEQAANDPDFRQMVARTGGAVRYSGHAAFGTFWQRYVQSIAALTRRIAERESKEAPK